MDTNLDEKSVHLDEVLRKFGAFGRYQIQTILLIGFAFFTNGMHCVNFVFVAEEANFRCKIEQCEQGTIFEAPWYNFTAPLEYRRCSKYESVSNGCSSINFNSTVVEQCTDWVYEAENSFVSELACQDWKRTFVGTVHSIGLMVGLFFQGQLSDKIGRKSAIIIAGLAAAVFGIAKSFAGSYTVYILLELLEATFGDNCSPAYIMRNIFFLTGIELVHGDYRLQQQIFLCIIYASGAVSMSIAAYCLPYWRNFVQAIYAPSLIFILYYLIMDESVRWLLSKGKKKEAIKILRKISKYNQVELDEKVFLNIQYEHKGTSDSPLRDTFRSKIVVKRLLVCLVWWMSCTFICFGLIVNVASLAGNKYINFGLMSLCDIPASFAMVFILKKFKRKKPLFLAFMIASLFCLVQAFVPKEYMWLSTGLYLVGKFMTAFTFSTVYMYTSELFPTYTRNSMHALCSAIGRVGSVVAPMTPLLTQYMESLPTLLISGISMLAGLVTTLVPDLADDPLPDNVKQAERMGACHVVPNIEI